MSHATPLLLALLVLTCPSWAAAEDRPSPPLAPPPDGPRGDGRPSYVGPHRGVLRDGGFDHLPEADKQRVREAMDKAWKKPEMQAAKDKFMKASEEFRNSLRETLQGIDPEVVKILDKVKPPMPWEMRGPPPPPKPEDPDFARRSVARLGFEFMAFGKPEQRDALRKLHERVLLLEPVKAAMAKLEAAPVGERMEALKTLREVYKKEVEREISEFRQKRQPTRLEEAKK
jgi:hypothetical protein